MYRIKLFSKFTLVGACLLIGLSGLAPTQAGEKPGQVIDFEGDVVEGMNRRPLDSLSQISDGRDGSDKVHLYRKRSGFRSEIQETLKEIQFHQ